MINWNRLTYGLCHLGEEGRASFLDFFLREILLVGCQAPLVAEWIYELPASIAPEPVGHGHLHRGAGCYGLIEGAVHVFNKEVETNGCASKALRPAAAVSGLLL